MTKATANPHHNQDPNVIPRDRKSSEPHDRNPGPGVLLDGEFITHYIEPGVVDRFVEWFDDYAAPACGLAAQNGEPAPDWDYCRVSIDIDRRQGLIAIRQRIGEVIPVAAPPPDEAELGVSG